MTMDFLQEQYEEAWKRSLSWKQNIFAFVVLVVCGIFFLFFQTLAADAGPWTRMSLRFIPLFLSCGMLFSSGILLIRWSEREQQERVFDPLQVFVQSPEILLASSYFSMPFLFAYLIIWFLQGIFLLLTEVPVLGSLIGTFFAFAPFLLHVSTLLLFAAAFFLLFSLPAIIAMHGLHRIVVIELISIQFRQSPFRFLFLPLAGAFPLLVMLSALLLAASWTQNLIGPVQIPFLSAIQGLCLLLPSAVFLAPCLVFFFQFSFQVHRSCYPKTI